MNRTIRTLALRAAVLATSMTLAAGAWAAGATPAQRLQGRSLPASVRALAVAKYDALRARNHTVIDPSMQDAQGRQRVIVRLKSPSVAEGGASRAEVRAEQDALVDRIRATAPTARQTGAAQVVLNAVFLSVDAKDLVAISKDAAVGRVAPVSDYTRADADTTPYIGATAVQRAGYTGARVRVAVLDSGIDYTHAAFGGPGTFAAYQAAYGTSPSDPANTVVTPGVFPTARVIGGYDFVGEVWPNGPNGFDDRDLAPDPNPISGPDVATPGYCDSTCYGGHGTHVADIIGGRPYGVAPDVKLLAVKVCATYATSCNGVALIEGMDFAVDPNGDGSLRDHVDIINMSLGGTYGLPFDDDLSAAVDNATRIGVLTVAAAGNGGDKPYVTGTPAAASTALSVAQTAMPLAYLGVINPGNRLAVPQDWAPKQTTAISGPVTYNVQGNPRGCNPFAANSLTGQVVLVDRGKCAGSIKVANASAAGAAIVIVGLVDGSTPFSFSYGGGTVTAPAYMISLADANAIRGGATVSIDPAGFVTLAGSVVSTSSRGPGFQGNTLKPEIGAPGASISAQSGTGSATGGFGGTSGATPMVAGSAALLKSARPGLRPLQLKQILVNTASTRVRAPSVKGGLLPDIQAPVSRIGGGEVRVDRAVMSPVQIYDTDNPGGGLTFGFVDAWRSVTTIRKRVAIENFSSKPITLKVAALLGNHADGDAATGAVSLSAPPSVTIGGRDTRTIEVELHINGALLRNNLMNSALHGADPQVLTAMEYDGYLTFSDAKGRVYHLPWHVLPRKSAKVEIEAEHLDIGADGTGTLAVENHGVGAAQYDAYSLLGTGPRLRAGARGALAPNPSVRAAGVATYDAVGLCSSGFAFGFAVDNWKRYALPMAVSNIVWVDTDGMGVDARGDGTKYNYAILNRDLSFSNITDGRQLAWVLNLKTGQADFDFLVGHPTNAANLNLVACGERLGLGPEAILSKNLRVVVEAQDFFFGGPGGAIGPFNVVPFGERYVTSGNDTPAKQSGTLTVLDFGNGLNPADQGVLLYTNAQRADDNNGGATADSEALVVPAKGVTLKFEDD